MNTDAEGRRVFWPGDELPVGIWVVGPSGKPTEVWAPGTTVQASQPDPLVEVPIPDYRRSIRHAWGQRWAKEEHDKKQEPPTP